jgi:hypothetical protein
MKEHGTMEVEIHAFFNSALGGNEWLFDQMGQNRSAQTFGEERTPCKFIFSNEIVTAVKTG